MGDFLAVGFARWSDVLYEFDGKTIDDFLALGFDRWSKTYLPCIQLGPYDVPPDGFRDSWMKMRSTCAKGNRKLSRLIFWYGTTEENSVQGFSFLSPRNVVSYEEGCRRGYNTINKRRKKNILFINGMKELEEDAKREPDERLPRVRDHIVERYEIEHEDVIESDECNKEKIHNEISSYSRAPRQLNTKKSKIMSRQQNDEKKTHFKDMRDSIQRIKSEEEKIIDGMNIGSKMGLPEGLKVTKSIKGLYDIIRPVGNQWKLTKKHKIDVLDVTSELDIPEGWKVTKSIKGYGIIRPNGSQFDGGLGALAEYLGTKISYNGFEYSEKYKKRKLIKEKIDVLDVTSELDIPEGWKVTKSIKGYGIIRPNGIQFDGGLGAL